MKDKKKTLGARTHKKNPTNYTPKTLFWASQGGGTRTPPPPKRHLISYIKQPFYSISYIKQPNTKSYIIKGAQFSGGVLQST